MFHFQLQHLLMANFGLLSLTHWVSISYFSLWFCMSPSTFPPSFCNSAQYLCKLFCSFSAHFSLSAFAQFLTFFYIISCFIIFIITVLSPLSFSLPFITKEKESINSDAQCHLSYYLSSLSLYHLQDFLSFLLFLFLGFLFLSSSLLSSSLCTPPLLHLYFPLHLNISIKSPPSLLSKAHSKTLE